MPLSHRSYQLPLQNQILKENFGVPIVAGEFPPPCSYHISFLIRSTTPSLPLDSIDITLVKIINALLLVNQIADILFPI